MSKALRIGVFMAVLSILGHTGVARAAQDEDATPAKEWYGAPILIGGGIGGVALGAEAFVALYGRNISPALWVPTAAVYLLTGPVVHVLHHENGRAFGSLALNAVVPLGAALLAGTILLLEPNCDHGLPHDSGPSCSRVVPLTVLGAGFVAGPLIDGLALARHVHKRPADVSFTPFVLPAARELDGGLTLGVAGSF